MQALSGPAAVMPVFLSDSFYLMENNMHSAHVYITE